MAPRLLAAALVTLGALELLALAVRALLGPLHAGLADIFLCVTGIAGILLLAANGVTNRSAGAVHNAAGALAGPAPRGGPSPDPGGGAPFLASPAYRLLLARAL